MYFRLYSSGSHARESIENEKEWWLISIRRLPTRDDTNSKSITTTFDKDEKGTQRWPRVCGRLYNMDDDESSSMNPGRQWWMSSSSSSSFGSGERENWEGTRWWNLQKQFVSIFCFDNWYTRSEIPVSYTYTAKDDLKITTQIFRPSILPKHKNYNPIETWSELLGNNRYRLLLPLLLFFRQDVATTILLLVLIVVIVVARCLIVKTPSKDRRKINQSAPQYLPNHWPQFVFFHNYPTR